MSERMIELQRAKLGLPPAGNSPAPSIRNSLQSPGGSGTQSQEQAVAAVQQTPQQAAVASLQDEDTQMQRFIHRLQRRDDSHPIADSTCGPTVPTALSRRMLHRQGVGYLDDTVAAIASASADRFLATVLQQAVACRDQRLKGAEMARDAARHRKRHMQHYEADINDRKRRKEEIDEAREKSHLATILAAESLRKGGGASKDSDDKKSKKKKKPAAEDTKDPVANGKKPEPFNDDGDDDSYDSIDEEEEYYQEQLGDVHVNLKGEDEEDDDMLQLRDLVRPLEAWDFHLTGKTGLEIQEEDSDDEEGDEEDEEDIVEKKAPNPEENGSHDDDAFGDGADADKSEGKPANEDSPKAPAKKRKLASSPSPNPNAS
jgi:hypothetical protein